MKHHVSKEILDARPTICDMCGGDNGGKAVHLDHSHQCREKVYVLNKKTKNMVIDRAHPSKKACQKCFRGWLCYRCNRFVLGRLTLEQAETIVWYLKRHKERNDQ